MLCLVPINSIILNLLCVWIVLVHFEVGERPSRDQNCTGTENVCIYCSVPPSTAVQPPGEEQTVSTSVYQQQY